MILLLDMGNSRLKSAVLSNSGKLTDLVFTTYGQLKPIEVLRDHLARYPEVKSVRLVSVLGREFKNSVEVLLDTKKLLLKWIGSERQAYGVKNHYKLPTQLGSDRFVALVAARKAFPDNCCIVVDCGTAVTVDALTNTGEFCGGVIIPGLKLWGDSLIGRADQLDEHQEQIIQLFAKDTAQAIGTGSVLGLTSAIEGLCVRMSLALQESNQAQTDPKFIICGGDADLVSQHSTLKFEVMPNLVLMGLAEYN